jgi:hypothetical protein
MSGTGTVCRNRLPAFHLRGRLALQSEIEVSLQPTLPQLWWAGGRVVLVLLVAAPLAAADALLFPTPLHFVRTIHDPIAGAELRSEEYCFANRIVTVIDRKTAIVDYGTQEVIEIDRLSNTYSVSRLDELARERAILRPVAARNETWTTTPLGVKAAAGGSADAFEIVSSGPENVSLEISVARDLTVSREAFEALLGSAYPDVASEQQTAICLDQIGTRFLWSRRSHFAPEPTSR